MPQNVKPITPDEIAKSRASEIPDEVIDAFNDLLKKKFDGEQAIIEQIEVVHAIMVKMDLKPEDREVIFAERWLNIAPLFGPAGWRVVVHEPHVGNERPAYYTFTRLPMPPTGGSNVQR
jgi:hypothetical protein